MNKRQLIILWVVALSIAVFFILQPVIIVPILIIGGLSFWSFKDIASPLTKRFKFWIIITIISLILLTFPLLFALEQASDFWFVKSSSRSSSRQRIRIPRKRILRERISRVRDTW